MYDIKAYSLLQYASTMCIFQLESRGRRSLISRWRPDCCDDIVDIEILIKAGLSAVPSDAVEEAKNLALFVSTKNGGRGAVREFIELILKSSGRWESVSGESID